MNATGRYYFFSLLAIGCLRRLFIEITRPLFGGPRPAIPVARGGEEGKKEHNANFNRNLNKHMRHEINGNVSGSIERGTGRRRGEGTGVEGRVFVIYEGDGLKIGEKNAFPWDATCETGCTEKKYV